MDKPARREDGTIIAGGPSLNPGGRPKAIAEFQSLIRERFFDQALTALGTCLTDEDGRVRMMAVKEVFDRLFGKAPQAITGEDGKPITLGLGQELAEAFKRLMANGGQPR